MLTMEPAIRYGRAGRDRRLLPDDEYVSRMLALRDAIASSDLDALAVFGHPAAGGAFIYLAGYVPTMGFSAVVATADDEPVLISASGPREVPFLRTQTRIADERPSPSLLEDAVAGVAPALAERLGAGARVGLVGAEANLDARSYARLHDVLREYSLADGAPVLDPLRLRKRPRELAVLAEAAVLARASAEAAARTGDGRAAVVEAHRYARAGGAHDVRVLVCGLPPGARALVDVGGELTVYCAVELSGYWGEASSGGEGRGVGTELDET
jgi:Xaa-Pro aminopeptidase